MTDLGQGYFWRENWWQNPVRTLYHGDSRFLKLSSLHKLSDHVGIALPLLTPIWNVHCSNVHRGIGYPG
jgi:hypothetical protein